MVNLIFVYRLDNGISRKRIPLQELDLQRLNAVMSDDAPAESVWMLSGRELTSVGLLVVLPTKYNAAVYILQPESFQ